jgi:hypothetical protein
VQLSKLLHFTRVCSHVTTIPYDWMFDDGSGPSSVVGAECLDCGRIRLHNDSRWA